MPQGPENYPGRLTAEEEAHIMTLTRPEDIADFLHQREIDAGLRVMDPMNPQVLHEVERPTPAPVSITVAGQTLSGTQEEVDAQLLNYFRTHPQTPLETTNDSAPRTADGRFARTTPTPEPSHTTGLDKITNNLVAKALAEEGISIEVLKETVAEKQAGRSYVQSWADAVEVFKNGPGADWPGDPTGELKARLTEHMQNIYGETDPPDKVEALTRAWQAMQNEADQYVALRDAKTPEEIKTILGTRAREEARIRQGRSY